MPNPAPKIRPVAVAVVSRGEELLLEKAFDSVKREQFTRPAGGGIEFGEAAVDAVSREIHEEFGLTFAEPRLLAVLENIFVHEGEAGHEVVFVFEGRFAEAWPYETRFVPGHEGEVAFEAEWLNPRDVLARGWKLYPDGFPELLGLGATESPPAGANIDADPRSRALGERPQAARADIEAVPVAVQKQALLLDVRFERAALLRRLEHPAARVLMPDVAAELGCLCANVTRATGHAL